MGETVGDSAGVTAGHRVMQSCTPRGPRGARGETEFSSEKYPYSWLLIQYTIRMAGTIDFKDLAVISHTSVRRERMHLLLRPDRAPIALSNGASPDDDALPMCFTLVQPIRSGGHVRRQTTKPN